MARYITSYITSYNQLYNQFSSLNFDEKKTFGSRKNPIQKWLEHKHWKKTSRKTNASKPVNPILVNWHISTCILAKITPYHCQIGLEMFQLTRNAMDRSLGASLLWFFLLRIHAEKSILNLVKWNQIRKLFCSKFFLFKTGQIQRNNCDWSDNHFCRNNFFCTILSFWYIIDFIFAPL